MGKESPSVEERCSKIELEDGRNLYFSIKEGTMPDNRCCWKLILTDGVTIYDTEVAEDILHDMAVGSSYSPQQFVDLFKAAFNLRQPDSDTILKYTLTSTSKGKDCFFWSIYLPNDNQTFRLGHLEVRPLPESDRAPVYCRMFDSLLSVTNKSKQEAEKCRLQSEEERDCARLACQKLDKFVTVQERNEKVLYTNFVAVLNEKKRIIRELQDQCEALKRTLASTSSSVDTVTQDVEPGPSRRGRGGKTATASRRSTKPPVSACTAPKRRTAKKSKGVEYDSESSTDMEGEGSSPTPKRSKRLIQSSDDEATDVDDVEPSGIVQSEPPVQREETGVACEETTASVSPVLDVNVELTALTLGSESAEKPGKSADTSPSKTATEALLDDLLEGNKPSTSTTTRKRTPVKRRAVPRGTQKKVSEEVPKARPTRRQKAASNSFNDSLMDDLLGGM